LGGSDEGWQQWASSIPASAAAAARNTAPSPTQASRDTPALERKLPPFSLRDIRGEQWTLERFQGKTVIAVVWASWCEPCRAELPYFAKLAERLSGRPDVIALSFNTDENPAIAESFAASQGYKFPVLLAKQYAEDLMPEFAIPRTWIIKNAAITSDHVGFGPNGQKWINEVVAELK
jgi:thiol-disulfide isomerase/thioredoxin